MTKSIKRKTPDESKSVKITKCPTRIRRRKKLKDTISQSSSEKIIMDFVGGETSHKILAERYSTTTENISIIITRHWTALTNLRETALLEDSSKYSDNHKSGSYHALKAIGNAASMNEKFTELLSDPNEPLLTDEEQIFAVNYIVSGNPLTALKDSGLHIGLIQEKGRDGRHKFNIACKLRIHYLKVKPNVAVYITKLREDKYVPNAVDKMYIQRELLEQLEQVKEDTEMNTSRRNQVRLRVVEALGKTIGAFSEVLKVEKVSPGDALDYLETLNQAEAKIVSPVGILELEG